MDKSIFGCLFSEMRREHQIIVDHSKAQNMKTVFRAGIDGLGAFDPLPGRTGLQFVFRLLHQSNVDRLG